MTTIDTLIDERKWRVLTYSDVVCSDVLDIIDSLIRMGWRGETLRLAKSALWEGEGCLSLMNRARHTIVTVIFRDVYQSSSAKIKVLS